MPYLRFVRDDAKICRFASASLYDCRNPAPAKSLLAFLNDAGMFFLVLASRIVIYAH